MQLHPDEYPAYYAPYLAAIEGADVSTLLRAQITEIEQLGQAIDDERAMYRYADGKWSIKELIGHIADCERIFGYRAMSIARGEQQPLPGFDENMYVDNAGFDHRAFNDLIDEFLGLRLANLVMFESLTPEQLQRMGNANGHPITVRAIVRIIAGHTAHHLNILRERYQ